MSNAHAQFAEDYQKQLQDGTLDAQDFKQKMSDTMDKIGENVSTRGAQLYFNQKSAELQSHFTEKAALGQAEIAGSKAKDDYLTEINNGSSALLNDPSSFEFLKQQQQDSLDAKVATGGLPAVASEKLKEHANSELAKSAIRGYIKLNPDDGKAQLDSGKWDPYVNGDVKHQLYGEADQANRAKDIEQARIQKAKNDAVVAQQNETQNKFLEKLSTGELSTKEILNSNLDAFGSGSKETFLNLAKKAATDSLKTDPYVYKELMDRIQADDNDPSKIRDPNEINKYIGSGLTMRDGKGLRDFMAGKGTPEGDANAKLQKNFMNLAYQQIAKPDPVTKLADPQGASNFQEWLVNYQKGYSKAIADGKKPSDLFNPKSSDYLGADIANYQRTPEQIINDMVKGRKQMGAPGTPSEPMIDVLSPDGQKGQIPQSKVEAAKARGFKVGK